MFLSSLYIYFDQQCSAQYIDVILLYAWMHF